MSYKGICNSYFDVKTLKSFYDILILSAGETYLPIEAALAGRPGDRDAALEAKEYRGGGTLPRHGLQQVQRVVQ